MMAAEMPKFDPLHAGTAGPASAPLAAPAPELPAEGIIRLPSFVVHDQKLPTELEVMTPEELTRYAMNKYLGPEDGIDRGVLNLANVRQFWNKIPVLGSFPLLGFETNEARALRLYHEDVRRQEQADLRYMSRFEKDTGRAAEAGAMNHAIQAGFPTGPRQSSGIQVRPGDPPN